MTTEGWRGDGSTEREEGDGGEALRGVFIAWGKGKWDGNRDRDNGIGLVVGVTGVG